MTRSESSSESDASPDRSPDSSTGKESSENDGNPSEQQASDAPAEDPFEGDRDVVVECSDLTKVYRKLFGQVETTAVKDLNLEIKRGEIFGLLGPNGSGKTTTMKLLLGLLFPTSGQARVLNRDPRNVSTKERIGFLPEESYLYDFLTGKETLEFYASLFGMSSQQQEEKVNSLLKSVGLWADRNRKLREYSKGMTRRIGFAQSLINDPDVIFLDEPTVGLDPIIARELKDKIIDLRDQGRTLIVSSHVLADVEDICDRVAILHDGIKRKEGDVDEMLKIRERLQVVIDTTDSAGETREQIRELLEDHGWTIRDFSHPGRTLEDLFLTTIREST